MKTQIIIFILIALLNQSVFSQTKKDLCMSQNPSLAILEKHSLTEIYNQFSKFLVAEKEMPLSPFNKENIKKKLSLVLANLKQEKAASERILNLSLSLPIVSYKEMTEIADSFLRDFESEKLKIEVELGNSTEPNKYLDREPRLRKVRASLLKIYQARLNEWLLIQSYLSVEDKQFLENWLLRLMPDGPTYKWSLEATMLHDYMRALNQKHNIISNFGKVGKSYFTVEVNMIEVFPGYSLRVPLRDPERPEEDFNVQMTFSPFSEEIDIKVCDFSKANYCEVMSVDQWCKQ